MENKDIAALIEGAAVEVIRRYFKIEMRQSFNKVGLEIRLSSYVEGLNPAMWDEYVQFVVMAYSERGVENLDYIEKVASGLSHELMHKIFRRK
jgi:hypothetical protein